MNILYIVCHDLGRHLGCYDRKVKTPTLIDAAGLEIPAELPGKSFSPLLKGEAGDYDPHQEIFIEWNFGGPQDDYSPVRAVRTATHKLIHNYGPHHYGVYSLEEISPDFTREQMQFKRFKDYGGPYQHPSDRMRDEWELYDLQADPNELHNLWSSDMDEDTRQLFTDLSARILEWQEQTSDYLLEGAVPTISEKPGFHYQS